MKSSFRVLVTKWILKSSIYFWFGKKNGKVHLVCPYLPANIADRKWSFEFNSSTIVKISQTLVISVKRSSLPFNIYFKKNMQISDFNYIWSQRFRSPWTEENLLQLSNRISPVLPRSRSYHLLWITFVHRLTDFINEKMGELKQSGKKNINS